jgi:hypothetical protein
MTAMLFIVCIFLYLTLQQILSYVEDLIDTLDKIEFLICREFDRNEREGK